MSALRRRRIVTVLLSLCALLYTQLAVAAYACDGAARAVELAQMTESAMPCADSMAMDEEQPGLCHAHCQSDQGAPEASQPAHLAAATDFGPVSTLVFTRQVQPMAARVQTSLLRPSASPPLAISNCCFRI